MEDFAHPDGHPAGRVLLSVQENLLQALKEEHCSGKCLVGQARNILQLPCLVFIAAVGFSGLYLHV